MTTPSDFVDWVEPGGPARPAPGTIEDVLRWIAEERGALRRRVEESGALVLRGFPIRGAEDFDRLVRAFDLGRFSYRDSLSNAVRIDLTERVFTANEAPPEATIRLHHELAQTPAHPRFLFFHCETAAATGGATALCRSDLLFERIMQEEPAFAEAVERLGLVYHHVMPARDDPDSALGRSWRNTLNVDAPSEAEGKLRQLGYDFEWRGDDLAVTSPCLPAVVEVSAGRRTFFNQLVATRSWKDIRNDPESAVTLGDGSPIPTALRDAIAGWSDELAIDLEWNAGDVAVLDNHLVQHGRRSFEGRRRLLVAFSARAEVPGPA